MGGLFQAQVNTGNGEGWRNMSYPPRSYHQALKLIDHYQHNITHFQYRLIEVTNNESN